MPENDNQDGPRGTIGRIEKAMAAQTRAQTKTTAALVKIDQAMVGYDGRGGLVGDMREVKVQLADQGSDVDAAQATATEAKAIAEKNERRLYRLQFFQAGYTSVIGALAALVPGFLKGGG